MACCLADACLPCTRKVALMSAVQHYRERCTVDPTSDKRRVWLR